MDGAVKEKMIRFVDSVKLQLRGVGLAIKLLSDRTDEQEARIRALEERMGRRDGLN